MGNCGLNLGTWFLCLPLYYPGKVGIVCAWMCLGCTGLVEKFCWGGVVCAWTCLSCAVLLLLLVSELGFLSLCQRGTAGMSQYLISLDGKVNWMSWSVGLVDTFSWAWGGVVCALVVLLSHFQSSCLSQSWGFLALVGVSLVLLLHKPDWKRKERGETYLIIYSQHHQIHHCHPHHQ